MELDNVKCIDLEIAIMRQFNGRQNLIVPNVTNMMGVVKFETDMLVLTKCGYAYGFEIKVSRADLKADFKKPQHTKIGEMMNGRTGMERYYGKFKHFYYAVPEQIKEMALELIPPFCGLWVLYREKYPGPSKFYLAKEAKILFNYKWSESDQFYIAKLGTMRLLGLKEALRSHLKN